MLSLPSAKRAMSFSGGCNGILPLNSSPLQMEPQCPPRSCGQPRALSGTFGKEGDSFQRDAWYGAGRALKWKGMQHQRFGERIVKALIAVQPAETAEALRARSADAIKDLLGCPFDEAATIVKDYEDSKIVELQITPRGGQLSPRENMPRAKFKWVAKRP